jgi:hypothetical protein
MISANSGLIHFSCLFVCKTLFSPINIFELISKCETHILRISTQIFAVGVYLKRLFIASIIIFCTNSKLHINSLNLFGMVSNQETKGETKDEPISIAEVIISQPFIENALKPKLYSYIFIN